VTGPTAVGADCEPRVAASVNNPGLAAYQRSVEAISSPADALADFDAAYARLFDELCALCRALGAPDEAQDVAQEALLYGRAHLRDLRDERNLRPWLRRIAARGAAQARRRRLPSLDGTEPSYVPVDLEAKLDCSAAAARLPERERFAIALVYGLGYPQEEAAQVLGIARGTVAASLLESPPEARM
jgi:RNA polymerase sigma factor (sigma-70 family)